MYHYDDTYVNDSKYLFSMINFRRVNLSLYFIVNNISRVVSILFTHIPLILKENIHDSLRIIEKNCIGRFNAIFLCTFRKEFNQYFHARDKLAKHRRVQRNCHRNEKAEVRLRFVSFVRA